MKSPDTTRPGNKTTESKPGNKASLHPLQLLRNRQGANPFQLFTEGAVSQLKYNPLQLLTRRARSHSVAPVQRVLANTDVFQSEDIIKQLGGEGAYLAIYSAIRQEALSYNETCEALDVVERLHKLEKLQADVRKCLLSIAEGDFSEADPAQARKGHLGVLTEAIMQEKAAVVKDKTTEKNILARVDGVVREGTNWEVSIGDVWKDARLLTQGARQFEYTITKETAEYYLADVQVTSTKTLLARIPKADVMKDQYKESVEPLYPRGSPVKEDVLQTNLGDCYLQAALAGLAARDPAFIKGMLFDNGSEVIVRLFRLPERTPQFLRLPRSTAIDSEGEKLYNNGALWVKMIQKAYAAGNFAGNLNGKREFFSIKDIEGDIIGYTMGVLTGREIKSHAVSGESLQDAPDDNNGVPWGYDIGDMWDVIQDEEAFPTKEADLEKCKKGRDLLRPLFGDNFDLIKEWAGFVEEGETRTDLFNCKTLENFTAFFADKPLDEDIKEGVVDWATTSGLYRGAVGTGIYSLGQIAVLGKLEEALSSGKLLATGTNKQLSDDSSGGSGQSGEPKYKGLAGGHAYSILGIRKNRTNNPESDEAGNIHWVQLRNPWGKYGRTYNEHWKAQAIEEGDGVFWVELSDMATSFMDFEII